VISFETDEYNIDEDFKELAIQAINKSLDYLDFEYKADITLTTTTNSVIQEINNEHRGLDKATDVLSFPMIDWPYPCDYKFLDESLIYHKNPDTDDVLLGDIVLSMEKVISQANEYQHSIRREFTFLIVHSMLHLMGYDHITENEELEMIQLQKNILLMIKYE